MAFLWLNKSTWNKFTVKKIVSFPNDLNATMLTFGTE